MEDGGLAQGLLTITDCGLNTTLSSGAGALEQALRHQPLEGYPRVMNPGWGALRREGPAGPECWERHQQRVSEATREMTAC